MKNKLLVELVVPEIDQKYNIYIPINKKVGSLIGLLNKAVSELTNGLYIGTDKSFIYDRLTGERYDVNMLIKNTNIKNGTSLILL